jgi:hypothetical protein
MPRPAAVGCFGLGAVWFGRRAADSLSDPGVASTAEMVVLAKPFHALAGNIPKSLDTTATRHPDGKCTAIEPVFCPRWQTPQLDLACALRPGSRPAHPVTLAGPRPPEGDGPRRNLKPRPGGSVHLRHVRPLQPHGAHRIGAAAGTGQVGFESIHSRRYS